ncbi:MAG: DUF4976 domain-containing protein, partial [Flavobacteriaceae bacterium]|nr:DUF4976 domain-containing protein [Flavobacteriaceae bacterium]
PTCSPSRYAIQFGQTPARLKHIRVPFIISGPKIPNGSISNTPISGVDILPTIQALVSNNFELTKIMDGGSFKNNLFKDQNSKVIRNNDFLIFHLPFRRGSFNPHSAIIKDNFKLIKFTNTNNLLLFDLNNDINEKNNISNQLQKKTKELDLLLEKYLKDVKAPKWKQGINWRPSKKTLKEFNSFY